MTQVIDRDRGWKRLQRELRARPREVEVGIFGQNAAEGHEESPEQTIAEIMSRHEFGIGVPRRSWLRDWYDERIGEIRKRHRALMDQVVSMRIDLNTAVERLGLWMVGDIQKRWREGIPPPLDPVTVDLKGSSTPLIDTGQSRASVAHRVRVG